MDEVWHVQAAEVEWNVVPVPIGGYRVQLQLALGGAATDARAALRVLEDVQVETGFLALDRDISLFPGESLRAFVSDNANPLILRVIFWIDYLESLHPPLVRPAGTVSIE